MIEFRDALTMLTLLIAATSVILVSRNARRATLVQAQNTDLTRIRDLRSELAETKTELHEVRVQATQLAAQMNAANEAAAIAYRQRAEMLMYARMPGVTIEDWLKHFDQSPPELTEHKS